MRRFSIFALMIVVFFLAVAIAALRDANPVWAGILLLIMLLLLGTALLGTIYGEGRRRAGWLGFGVFAGSYLAMAIGPWLAESLGEKLPTTQLLHYVHSQAAATQQVSGIWNLVTAVGPSTPGAPAPTIQLSAVAGGQPGSGNWSATGSNGVVFFDYALAQPQAVSRWKSFFPGASNYEPFHQVGHSLFGLMAGMIGAVIARRFQASRERRQADVARDLILP